MAKWTVGDIWKSREKIEIVLASANRAFAKKRCIVRDAHFHRLDKACYLWFQQQRAKGTPVSGPPDPNNIIFQAYNLINICMHAIYGMF